MIAGVLAEAEVLAADRSVRLRGAAGAPRVRADRDLLRRALTNLVENAIRYAPGGTTVTVSSVVTDGGTLLRVADEGRGIPAELRDRIFDSFVQAEPGEQDERQANRGLGLSFCRAAAAAHGGVIWVEDVAPGAVFCVRLPDERHDETRRDAPGRRVVGAAPAAATDEKHRRPAPP